MWKIHTFVSLSLTPTNLSHSPHFYLRYLWVWWVWIFVRIHNLKYQKYKIQHRTQVHTHTHSLVIVSVCWILYCYLRVQLLQMANLCTVTVSFSSHPNNKCAFSLCIYVYTGYKCWSWCYCWCHRCCRYRCRRRRCLLLK